MPIHLDRLAGSRMRVHGFDWDDSNWPKCARHGVTKDDIESLFGGVVQVFPAKEGLSGETRHAAVGVTGEGRHVFVVFTFRHDGDRILIRPVSARFMHDKEIRHYERQKGSQVLP
jgi:uncharacterized DUF497 family protein